MTKKITFSLLAILVSGCVIICVGLVIAAVFVLRSQKSYTPPVVEPTEMLSIDEQMDRIQQQVSEIRGLKQKTALDRSMMTTSELKDEVENEFFADYTPQDAKNDVAVLSIIGLLKPDFDLLQFYKDLYSEQVAGYYDSETKKMNVISDAGFTGLERMTYAHEYTHVLQDQNYDMENGLKLNTDYCETHTEYCAALGALIEGDATLAEQYWFLTDSTDQDKTDVSDFQSSYKSPVYDSAPAYMKQDFLFPYSQGFQFVNQLYGKDKWQTIDEAYQNPPVSTEQILHPEKYPDDKPIEVALPNLILDLGNDWKEIDRNTMGEWYSYLILSAGIDPRTRLGSGEAATATAGWGGDTYSYCENHLNGHIFTWLSQWDTAGDAEEFISSSREYGLLRWGNPAADDANSVTWDLGSGSAVTMQRSGSEVLWVISNDADAYQKVLSRLTLAEY